MQRAVTRLLYTISDEININFVTERKKRTPALS
jgi:hypothetical protein